MSTYYFNAQVQNINNTLIVRVPIDISQLLPSRGMNMARCTLNHHSFVVPLEPDGRGGHLIPLESKHVTLLEIEDHEVCDLTIDLIDAWEPPDLPVDLDEELKKTQTCLVWQTLTAKAQWEWVRWIRFTKNPATRHKRIQTCTDMLSHGKRRPCCFDHSRCTLTAIAKSGIINDDNLS